MKTFAVVLVVSVVVGFMTWYITPAEVVSPFTYDVPVKIISRDGDNIQFRTQRCNNTGSDLTVSLTAYWESSDRTLAQVQPIGAGTAVVKAGCDARGGNPINIAYLPAGTWRIRGSVCTPDFCSGYFSEWFSK